MGQSNETYINYTKYSNTYPILSIECLYGMEGIDIDKTVHND